MDGHASKKDFFYIVVLILTFITVIVGVAFAIYAWVHRQEEGSSAVYTGTLTIEYLSGNVIDFHLLYPASKPNINTTTNVYRNDFRVTNTGNLDGIVTVTIDVINNEFSNNTLKYVLYSSDGTEITSSYINGTEDVVIDSNLLLEGYAVKDYVLFVWLDESNAIQNNEMQKSMSGTINIDTKQKID